MKAIETTALTKRYKDKIAVDALNLTIDQGELFALLGVNGAGKTTTIKMLSCLLRPTSGDALLMGKSIVSQPYEVKKNINAVSYTHLDVYKRQRYLRERLPIKILCSS